MTKIEMIRKRDLIEKEGCTIDWVSSKREQVLAVLEVICGSRRGEDFAESYMLITEEDGVESGPFSGDIHSIPFPILLVL